MRFLTSYKGIAIVALIVLVLLGVDQSGVFGDTRIGLTLKTNQSLNDGLVAHYTFDGDFETGTFEFGSGGATTTDPTSSGNETANAIVADESGYLYIAGYCNGCGTYGGNAHYTYKLNPLSGNVVWATTTDPTSSDDEAEAMAIDSEGFLLVTGECNGCGSAGGWAYYTYKIDPSDGAMVWATTTDPTSGFDLVTSIAVDRAGDVYAGGDCDGCGSSGGDAHYVFKLDGSDGSMLWSTTSDPTSAFESVKSITTDSAGYVYVAGECVGCGVQGGIAMYTYKLDSDDASLLWSTTTDPTSSSDRAFEITADGNLGVYLTGSCGGCGSAGGSAFYTQKLDPTDGNVVWATTTDPSSSAEEAHAITADDLGNLYITGYCLNCGSFGATAHYTLKASAIDGSMDWGTTTDPTNSTDTPYGIAVDGKGNPIATGMCDGCGVSGGQAHYTYKMDASDGTMIDTTSAGAIQSVGAKRVQGNIGQGIELDGVGDYVDLGNAILDPSDEQISIALWVKPEDLTQENMLIGKRIVSGNDGYNISLQGAFGNDPWRFTINGVVDQNSDARDITAGEWVHLVVTYDKQNIIFYENGELLSSHAQTGEVDDASSLNLMIGARNTDGEPQQFFEGAIDDVRIYSRAITAEEARRIYGIGATTKINKTLDSNDELTQNLLLHYTFDGEGLDTASNTAEIVDVSGNGMHANWYEHGTTTVPGVIGQAVSKPNGGVTDYIFEPDMGDILSGETEATVAFWARSLRPDSVFDNETIFMTQVNTNQNVVRYVVAGNSNHEFEVTDTAGVQSDTDVEDNNLSLDEGRWYHFVGRYRDGVASHWIDGELIEYSSAENNGTIRTGTGDDFGLLWTNYQGDLDDFRIYNAALSTSTIKRLYELGATTKVNTTIDTNPDLERGLVGHWTFDGKDRDTSSTTAEIQDRSESGLTGDLDASGEFTVGKIGQGLSFEQSILDSVHVDDTSLLEPTEVTLSLWTKSDQTNGGSEYLVGKRYQNGDPWNSYVIDTASVSTYRFCVSTGVASSQTCTGSYDMNGDWQHLVATYDGTNISFYGDGLFHSSTSFAGPIGYSSIGANSGFSIGSIPSGSNEYQGDIDDVRVYNRVLSDAEILRLYQLGQ